MHPHVFDATITNVLDRFRHQIEAGDVVARGVEFDEVAARTNATFNESSWWRAVFFQQLHDELSLGHMPPVAVFERDEFLEVTGVMRSGLIGLWTRSTGGRPD